MDSSFRTLYIQRTYGGNTEVHLSDYDKKFIMQMEKLKKKYASLKNTKKCLVYLEEPPPIFPNILTKKVETKTEVPVVRTCPATKLDNKTCGAKLKLGKCFCGRHAKLEKK